MISHGLESPVLGTPRVIIGTIPAPGVNWSETVPAGVRWNLKSIATTLTTSAVPGSRLPIVEFLDGLGNVYYTRGPTQVQTAGIVARPYNYSNTGREQVTGTFVVSHTPIPDDVWMLAGFVFRSADINALLALRAGDQFAAPVFYVYEVTG